MKDARKLANKMIEIGKLAGRETVCVLTNMDEPLGYAVGNNLEIIEAIKFLKGDMPEDVKEVVLELGSYMMNLAGKGDDLIKQFNEVKSIIHKKWPNGKYIGYFQAHTNTYAPLEILKQKYETILNQENVIGLSIATRPDAISDECLEYLSELNDRTFLTVELGLQTIHESTTKLINRCHTLDCFEEMVKKLQDRNINVVVHIINGLPFETKEMMIETVKYLNNLKIDGIKIHMLHVLKDTALENLYKKTNFHILSKREYIDIVCDQLEYLDPSIVINRITGDPKIDDLIEPQWLIKKFTVLNDIDKEMVRRNSYQGIYKTTEV